MVKRNLKHCNYCTLDSLLIWIVKRRGGGTVTYWPEPEFSIKRPNNLKWTLAFRNPFILLIVRLERWNGQKIRSSEDENGKWILKKKLVHEDKKTTLTFKNKLWNWCRYFHWAKWKSTTNVSDRPVSSSWPQSVCDRMWAVQQNVYRTYRSWTCFLSRNSTDRWCYLKSDCNEQIVNNQTGFGCVIVGAGRFAYDTSKQVIPSYCLFQVEASVNPIEEDSVPRSAHDKVMTMRDEIRFQRLSIICNGCRCQAVS